MTGRLVAIRHAGTGELGSGLAALAHAGVVTAHDPLRPGTTTDIDHLVVAPTGLWVIHTRRGEGRVARKDVGGLLGADARLYVGGRDRTTLVPAIWKRVAAVRSVLGREWAAVPVRPVLCFVGADWRLFARPFELHGVLVTWPTAALALLARPGPCSPAHVDHIAATLEERLRPAS